MTNVVVLSDTVSYEKMHQIYPETKSQRVHMFDLNKVKTQIKVFLRKCLSLMKIVNWLTLMPNMGIFKS